MEKTLDDRTVSALEIGLQIPLKAQIQNALCQVSSKALNFDLDQLMEPHSSLDFILCGLPKEGMSLDEIGQLLRSTYPSLPIFLILSTNDRIERKNALKNGFTDTFFLPLDTAVFETKVEVICKAKLNPEKLYKSVKLLDLHNGSQLDFDTYVYLPANKRHLRYSSANSTFDQKKIDNLKKHNTNAIYISESEVQKFYTYSAKALKSLAGGNTLTETEKAEKMHDAIRNLVSDLFTDSSTGTENGKKVIEDCKHIVRTYISTDKEDNWYERILNATENGTDAYSHAGTTSTYASLFALALGLQNVEEIALAALLHDIGLAKVPHEIQVKAEDKRTAAEKALYEKHPEFSIEMIKDRKLVVSDLVHKIILQHHMGPAGGGFPKATPSTKVLLESQVLALADRFDEMTSVTPGRVRMSPTDAIHELNIIGVKNPTLAIIDGGAMKKILKLFPASKKIE